MVVGFALAFVVGVLVGQRCDEPAATATVECEPTVRERVVYRCAPDASAEVEDAGVSSEPEVAPPVQPRDALPEAPPPITPRERQQLLAWVRDQSVALDGCRTAAKETYRLTVTLQLTAEARVRNVAFNAAELPADVATCLRERMLTWVPPAELVRDGRPLVFGLTL